MGMKVKRNKNNGEMTRLDMMARILSSVTGRSEAELRKDMETLKFLQPERWSELMQPVPDAEKAIEHILREGGAGIGAWLLQGLNETVGINKKFEAVSAEAAARTANHPPEYQEGIARLHKYIHSNMHLMARTYQQATEHKFPAVAVFFDEELGENNFLPVPEKAFQRLLEEAGLSETWEQFQSQVTSDMVIPAIVELHTKDDHLFYAMTMLTPALLSALALEQQQNTDADGNPKSHYQRAMSWLIERDRFKTESGSTAQLAVKHDHWCASLNLTGLCNCRPEIKAGSRILTYPASILPNNGRRPTSG